MKVKVIVFCWYLSYYPHTLRCLVTSRILGKNLKSQTFDAIYFIISKTKFKYVPSFLHVWICLYGLKCSWDCLPVLIGSAAGRYYITPPTLHPIFTTLSILLSNILFPSILTRCLSKIPEAVLLMYLRLHSQRPSVPCYSFPWIYGCFFFAFYPLQSIQTIPSVCF